MFGQKKNKLIGATLIEVMTVLFVFSIIAVTFYAIWSMGLRFIIESKNYKTFPWEGKRNF